MQDPSTPFLSHLVIIVHGNGTAVYRKLVCAVPHLAAVLMQRRYVSYRTLLGSFLLCLLLHSYARFCVKL